MVRLIDSRLSKLELETLTELEYGSVLRHISRYSFCSLGEEIILDSLPYEDISWLRHEHDLIEEAVNVMMYDDPLPVEGLADVRENIQKSKVVNSVLSTTALLSVKDTIRTIRLIKQFFASRNEKHTVLNGESSRMHENRLLEKHIGDAIEETGEVRDNATRELSRIRKEIKSKSARLRSRLRKILQRTLEDDLVREDFVSIREGRFVLPVKSEHKRHLPGIIHGVSQTGATVFLEPSEIIETNNELALLDNEEKREIYKILSNLTAELGAEADEFLRSVDIAAHIDAVFAKAKYALEFGGLKPEITGHSEIHLKDIRHPLLVHSKGRGNVVPLNIEFSAKSRGHLISGPNAGGKTVALKSIGLNIAMALSGIFPLGVCRTNILKIFSSIGDHQSIENDLSTFSSQMYQLKDIVNNCDMDSLVLIDEIGSGTDPQEGAALASGILDRFIDYKLFFVATTHQSSLKTYALTRDVIENASLEFDEIKLQPTYKFLSGIPGNSYAFVLAETIGLPETILTCARQYLGTHREELEKSISVLQKYRSEAMALHAEAELEKIKAEKLRKDNEAKYADINRKRKELINTARQDALRIVADANKMIERTIKEVREEKKSIAEIKRSYEAEKQQLEDKVTMIVDSQPNQGDEELSGQKIAENSTVSIIDTSGVGTVIEIDTKHKTALIETGGLKIRLPLARLKPAKKKAERPRKTQSYIKYDAKSRIDLRGKRAEAALREVDDFISDALLGGLNHLTIVHGKGTGALKEAVHEFLAGHQSIDKFRIGELTEGGAGVTIVEL